MVRFCQVWSWWNFKRLKSIMGSTCRSSAKKHPKLCVCKCWAVGPWYILLCSAVANWQLGAFRLGIRRESDVRWAVLRDAWGSCFVVFRGSETVLDWTENSGLLEMVSFQVLENLWLFQFQLGTISPLSSQSGWPAFEVWLLGHFWGNRMDVEENLLCSRFMSMKNRWKPDYYANVYLRLKENDRQTTFCYAFHVPQGYLSLRRVSVPAWQGPASRVRREWEVLFQSSFVQLGDEHY